ncbi:hypothetical protein H9S87_18645 (plasmid) [Bacillus pumilus]|uniref:hypothetical protein n=1 Tax=Bacillus pumilus TaxID=1408 RepID=UPI001657A84E|nr:hypothetical protein [Bacillus pumilus]QNP18304.1 hypothetical protein H9S87_18645 [Bacillus pumilus]
MKTSGHMKNYMKKIRENFPGTSFNQIDSELDVNEITNVIVGAKNPYIKKDVYFELESILLKSLLFLFNSEFSSEDQNVDSLLKFLKEITSENVISLDQKIMTLHKEHPARDLYEKCILNLGKVTKSAVVYGLISKINSYLNTKTFEVELDITQHFTTTVTVTGDFEGVNDPDLDEAAKQAADRMAHDDWNWEETEFDVRNAKLLKG